MSKKVVLIDDDETFTGVTSLMIEKLRPDLQVEVYNQAQKALESSDATSADLLLVDIYMPEMNGWQLLEAINEEGADPDMDIYIVSSSVDHHDRIKAESHSRVTEFVTKPLTLDKLRKTLATM